MGPSIGERNITLNGRARQYHVPDFPGPLSIKSVISGSAVWQTDEGCFQIGPGTCLLINDRQPYSITVESKSVVETFCVFFAPGFVEDVWRVITSTDSALLDQPAVFRRIEFHERMRAADPILTPLLQRLYRRPTDQSIILRMAEALAGLREDSTSQAAKLPAVKAATREELLRRVYRARNVIEGSLGASLSLRHIAREAALSPYYLHRSFTRLFHETPHAYLVRRRLEHAARLLKTTSLPVTEVCLACGFESLGSFSSLFRRHSGASPRQFRKAHI